MLCNTEQPKSTEATNVFDKQSCTVPDDDDDNERDVPIRPFGKLIPRDSIAAVGYVKSNAHDNMSSRSGLTDPLSDDDNLTVQDSSRSSLDSSSDSTQHEESGSVRFGSVRVHKHRMTLGDHPSARGLPVMLAWEVDDSEEIDLAAFQERQREKSEYEQRQEPGLRRLDMFAREEIARRNHTRESLTKVQVEMFQIQKSRMASKNDNVDQAARREERQRRRKQKRGHKREANGLGHGLKSFFQFRGRASVQ